MPEPIGSIIAYAGPIDERWEIANGWMLCDGRLLHRSDPTFVLLFDAIGFTWGGDLVNRFNLPDLRGYFLRGVDGRKGPGRDPDSATRSENNPGGQKGDSVGTVQGWGTALPQRESAFMLSDAGRHHHILDFELDAARDVDGQSNTVAYPSLPGVPPYTTDPAGLHTHDIQGGHRETRPINAYVHWIIRFQ
jgi:hypothetical protein